MREKTETMVLCEFTSSHFDWKAFGRDKKDARKTMKRTFREHFKGISNVPEDYADRYFAECEDGFHYTKFVSGNGFVDGLLMTGPAIDQSDLST